MPEHDLRTIAFPTLTEKQIGELARYADGTRRFQSGERLFHCGERGRKFFVVKSGEIEIIDETGDAPKSVTTHAAGGFSGDIDHLTGNPSVVSGVARTEGEALEISTQRLREVLNQLPHLSDIILQAFIARRQLLRESESFIGLRVIGSRYSQDTFRIRDFLAKNHVLFTWLDLENDPAVAKMLEQFG